MFVAPSNTSFTEAGVSAKRKKPKVFLKVLRIIGFLTIGLILRWPIWIALWMMKIVGIKFFDYLFLVYPGTDKDLDGYCPRWLAKSWLFSTKPSIGGIISKAETGRGLILVVPNTTVEFLQRRDICEKTTKRLKWIKNIIGAKAIALAGQMPSMLKRNNIKIEEPFVKGNKGTVFCVAETIDRTISKHDLIPGEFQIALVGVGYVGKLLMDHLESEGHNVVGIDIEIQRHGVKLQEEAPGILITSDMVIVLTPRGEDFNPYVDFLKPGAIVIDDTHPKILKKPKNVFFYKVAVGLDKVRFFPRLPGYRSDWIPGCAIEAIISSTIGGGFNGISQINFNNRARKIGFYAHLV